jgi:hypothetical protein
VAGPGVSKKDGKKIESGMEGLLMHMHGFGMARGETPDADPERLPSVAAGSLGRYVMELDLFFHCFVLQGAR